MKLQSVSTATPRVQMFGSIVDPVISFVVYFVSLD